MFKRPYFELVELNTQIGQLKIFERSYIILIRKFCGFHHGQEKLLIKLHNSEM